MIFLICHSLLGVNSVMILVLSCSGELAHRFHGDVLGVNETLNRWGVGDSGERFSQFEFLQ